ncbi:MAG: hypothetical protein U9Q40_06255 [Campylobacterota bacterium]|nr:hypothetical protein [Campylobacterota bacterium]
MLSKFFESIYQKVLVNIVVRSTSTDVYIELCSKNDVVDNIENNFTTTKMSEEMLSFITSYTRESPFFYISILDMSSSQGALPTCSKNKLSYYYDVSASEYKCHDKKWTYYTSKSDLYEIERRYKETGVDFVFSPFSLLSNFFKDKIDTNLAMYILVQDEFVSLGVFDNSELLFAQHLNMESSHENDEFLMDDSSDILDFEDDGIDLEDVDVVDSGEMFDDLNDIEDLDSLEEIDEFSENKDVEEEFHHEEEEPAQESEDTFNEDYHRYTLIQSAINRFYKDEKYESQFIENIYVADSVGVSSELKRYLEEEMFLSVYVRHLELGVEVAELTRLELGI